MIRDTKTLDELIESARDLAMSREPTRARQRSFVKSNTTTANPDVARDIVARVDADFERIFDKFYRAHKVDQVRAGAGLGLAISRGFIEAMPATISAANRIDRTGAVFTIRLPVPTQVKQLDTAA